MGETMGLFARLKSDLLYLSGVLRSLRRITRVVRNPERTFPSVLEDLAGRFGDRVALIGEGERLTYGQYNARANAYARWVLANGIAKGETVALLMHNRPEYLVVWLGVTRAGAVCALLNTHLTGTSLAHCLNIVAPKHIIVGADLLEALESAMPHLDTEVRIWVHGAPHDDPRSMEAALEGFRQAALSREERRPVSQEDPCLFIFTSGTTGLPKAANVNHYRVQAIMNGFSGATNAQADDRVYVCLPLYHTSGGVLAPGTVLTVGGSVVIRNGFSASAFWSDVVRHECTMFQYIGEMCRYLLNSPVQPDEGRHKVRLCCGNGLRPDIWDAFKSRYKIPDILEFYAATESNVALINFDGQPGAVGRIPFYLRHKLVTEVIRFDIEAGAPLRNDSGHCIKAAPNEVGEVIGKVINDPNKPAQRFEGYADARETEKKILRDVFEDGDVWFRTGDLMRRDERGYFYFVDRVGDTFRWKGENVATSEVAETLTVFEGVNHVNVYGVSVPGQEGRAGMAVLVAEEGFDLGAFHRYVSAHLPAYARPLFLRLRDEVEVTTTFKQKKVELVEQGFDPGEVSDPLYFDDQDMQAYRVLDQALYEKIAGGELRI
jgi:fatty-acyl-CoA synthase